MYNSPKPCPRLAITLALYYTGRLHYDLFTFPQGKGAEILPSLRESLAVCSLLPDATIELGQVNLAEHFAHEAFELEGHRPHTLWQPARVHVLKQQPEALVWHMAATGSQNADLGGRRPSPDTVRRFSALQSRLAQNGGRAEGIEDVLARSFGDTFWFYHLLGQTYGHDGRP